MKVVFPVKVSTGEGHTVALAEMSGDLKAVGRHAPDVPRWEGRDWRGMSADDPWANASGCSLLVAVFIPGVGAGLSTLAEKVILQLFFK